jgi:hypothetical protein
VREGNRVCLVYNLIQKHSKGRRGTLQAPQYEFQITEAASILDRFLTAPEAPAKIAWLLDHQYSPAGLSFSVLKGADAAKSRVLVQAAARSQCDAYLAIVHIGESGAAEPDDDYWYRSPRNRYRHYQDEDDEGNGEDASFTVATVDDAWRYVDEWRDTDSRVVEFGRIPLAVGELLPAGALDGEPPDEKRITEASGNEGATYERSYHRAALVLWRRTRTVDVLLQAGVVAVLPYLKRLAAGGKGRRPEAMAVAEQMLDTWPCDAEAWNSYSIGRPRPGPADRIEMITAVRKLKATALLERFLREVVISSYDGSENAALLASVKVLGDTRAAAVLSSLVSAQMPKHPNECTELLLALSKNPSLCFPKVAEAAVASLDLIGTHDSERETFDQEREERQRTLGPQFLEHLLRGLQRFKSSTLCVTASEKIASRPDTFSPVALVVPAIERICVGRQQTIAAVHRSLQHLWGSATEFLLGCSEVPPQPPSDWHLSVELTCSCPDCQELQSFALDPAERVHRFRLRKERRRHLHNMIDRHRLDMTHMTERVGSPQTLVCTKDRRTFDRRMKQYHDEIAAMRTLMKMAPKLGVAAALCKRIQVAVKRAENTGEPCRG